MLSIRRWWQAFLAAALLVAVIALWVAFMPLQLGGLTSYVIVNGSSMEPNYHYGDLVILHQVSHYQVGDVVAYHEPVLGKYVLHRIIGKNLDHFILKGDNNSWTDSFEPVSSELVGKLWLSLPGVGEWVRWLRTPLTMAIVVGITAVILIVVLVNGKPRNGKKMETKRHHGFWQGTKRWTSEVLLAKLRQGRRMKTARAISSKELGPNHPSPEQPPVPGLVVRFKDLIEIIEVLVFVLGFIAIASLVLGIFAFTHPVRQDVPVDLKYQQNGSFSYSATAPLGVYDTGRVTTGEPIFPALTCSFNLQYIYNITGEKLAGLSGFHQLSATVEENTSHWTRTFPLEAKTSFSGNTFGVDVPVNLCFIQTIVSSMEEKTTLHPIFYTLTINPNVWIAGEISGQDFHDTLQTPLVMQFDQVHTYIFNTDPTVDPLNAKQDGAVTSTHEEANTLSLLGIKAPVSKLRTISGIGLGLSVLGLLILGIILPISARRSRQAHMQLRYGSILVDVQNLPLDTATPIIDVISMDDLARIAERDNTLILHTTSGHLHSYYLQVGWTTYRYTVDEAGTGSNSEDHIR
jgi:signal peptidase I